MKTKFELLLVALLCAVIAHAQTNTNLGTNAGYSGGENTSIGYSANDIVTGSYNVSVGSNAGLSLTTGSQNTFIGRATGYLTTTAYYNTFVGINAGYYNTTGGSNTLLGSYAGYNVTTGTDNVFVGVNCGFSNTTASSNSFLGNYAGYAITTGTKNVLMGRNSGMALTTADGNTALGFQSFYGAVTGSNNTAAGAEALYNTLYGGNTGCGYSTLRSNTTGYNNTAVGCYALNFNWTGIYNTAVGYHANVPGGGVYIENSTALGAETQITASNQIRLGNSNVTSIGGVVGWSVVSDGRFKRDVREDVAGLDFVNGLRPVSYTLDHTALDKFHELPDSVIQRGSASRKKPIRTTGFVAQEVEALVNKTGYVFGGVDAPQNDKDSYSIRYDQFVVPLVKAVQELSSKVEAQQQQIEALLEQLNASGSAKSGVYSKSVLYQNNANPFSSDTEIRMVIANDVTSAHIIVYNLEGTQLKAIDVKGRGDQRVVVSANELKAGIYLYALIADGKIVDTKRMVLMK